VYPAIAATFKAQDEQTRAAWRQALGIADGPALVIPGLAAFVGLYWYVRFLLTVTKRTIARVRGGA